MNEEHLDVLIAEIHAAQETIEQCPFAGLDAYPYALGVLRGMFLRMIRPDGPGPVFDDPEVLGAIERLVDTLDRF